MTEQWHRTAEPLVLHVIPTPRARGAQREARALVDRLDLPGERAHRLLCLFDGPQEVAPDLSLNVPGGGRPAEGFDPRVVPVLRAALRRLDPSVVVAHGGDPLKYLVPGLAGRRRPLVYYAIGTFAGPGGNRVRLGLWRRLVARADAIAAEGPEVQQECTELLGASPDTVVMTPNGRDTERFHPRPSRPDGAPLTLTFVGALTEGKRPDLFVELVASLRGAGLDFEALMVGDGPLRGDLVDPAGRHGISLLGSRPDVPELLRRSDLMVFPSQPSGEGMPGVLIEAGMSGVPVVATDVPGVRTIVAEGVTGLVVPVGDLNGLVSATSTLMDDGALRTVMGAAARRRCVDLFSLDAVATAWLGILQPFLPATSDWPG